MDTGYDAFLARELAAHNRRGDEADRLAELVAERALDLGNDAGRFLEWIAEHDTRLSEITIKSSTTGRRINARAALVANAPTWLRELILESAEIDDEALTDFDVRYANGTTVAADVALIANAPEWLRAELVDWLSRQWQLEDEVEARLADDERLREEDAAADRHWEAA